MRIKILKTKKRFRKGGLYVNPDTYWVVLLGIILITAMVSLVFGFFLFKKIDRELVLSVSNAQEQTQKINKERVEKVLEYFSAREERSKQIKNSPAPVIDPSL